MLTVHRWTVGILTLYATIYLLIIIIILWRGRLTKMLQFYDFEVFKYDWMVVIIDPANKKKTVIVNDKNN